LPSGVKDSEVKAFIAATKENQRNSIEEDGIESFDFFQCRDDSSRLCFMKFIVLSRLWTIILKLRILKRGMRLSALIYLNP
jgi:hypothetical protein